MIKQIDNRPIVDPVTGCPLPWFVEAFNALQAEKARLDAETDKQSK